MPLHPRHPRSSESLGNWHVADVVNSAARSPQKAKSRGLSDPVARETATWTVPRPGEPMPHAAMSRFLGPSLPPPAVD